MSMLLLFTPSTPSNPFVGEAGGELLSTTTVHLRDTTLGAGSEMLVSTFAVSNVVGVFSAGGEMMHVVTVPGGSLGVTLGTGAEMRSLTLKVVPSQAIPGGMLRLGVGV